MIPFPDASWTVVEGEASLVTSADIDGATARVTLGETAGPVRVTATLGGVVATFNLTATVPEPASISPVSGQGQTLTIGGISEPLTVLVGEIAGGPAPGLAVTFSGPANVLLHPLDGGLPANPLEQLTGIDGQAGVKVELLNGVTAGLAGGLRRAQFSNNVVITAEVGDELSTSFTIDTVGRTPGFTSDAVVNSATFLPGIVPGSLVSLFGTDLTEGISGTELAGGATTFGGTTVWFGDIPAPILSVTGRPDEQINVQAPFEIPSGQTTSVRVDNNGTPTTVAGIPVFSAQPGIFEKLVEGGITVGAVIHPDTGELVSPADPAARGEILAVFFTGGGPLEPAVATGQLGPVTPAVMTLPVTVGVDGIDASTQFTGYAPTFLGLYQANFTVPEQAGCGNRSLSIQVGAALSPTSTIVIQCP